MELNIATKGRAASMDVRRGRELVRGNVPNSGNANLPSIQGGGGLPGLAPMVPGGNG